MTISPSYASLRIPFLFKITQCIFFLLIVTIIIANLGENEPSEFSELRVSETLPTSRVTTQAALRWHENLAFSTNVFETNVNFLDLPYTLCLPDESNIPMVTILVPSAPSNTHRRRSVRETWGHFNFRTDIRIIFVIGIPKNDSQMEDVIQQEAKVFRDILRPLVEDVYANLTRKVVAGFEWALNCSKSVYYLKADDDMFINIPALVSFMMSRSKVRNTIFGRLLSRLQPVRDRESKWYVHWREFRGKRFPNFVTGPCYLLTGDVLPKIVQMAKVTPYLKLEDVFITGVLADRAGVSRKDEKKFGNVRPDFENLCELTQLVSLHDVNRTEMFRAWTVTMDVYDDCPCDLCPSPYHRHSLPFMQLEEKFDD